MATILIAEDDDLLAAQMAHTLRQAGHVPILARDARAALRAAGDRPEGMLLDVDVPGLSLEAMLSELQGSSATASLPLLVVTGQRQAISRLKGDGRVHAVLSKPVSGVNLRRSVDTLPRPSLSTTAPTLPSNSPLQRQLIVHLIAHGSHALAVQISRRLCVDRLHAARPQDDEVLTWADIAAWGQREGLLDAEQARLLVRVPANTTAEIRHGRRQ